MNNDLYHDRRLVVDLDGTLCEQTTGGDAYWTAKPKQDVIDIVNSYYYNGWHITIHTARGMRTYNEDVCVVKLMMEEKTLEWLDKHGVCYHRLIMGKPPGDKYVDDRGITPDEFSKKY